MTLVIMAAGMGSRFGGLKQITPFGPNNEFLLDYSVYDAIKAEFNKVIFIIKKENLKLFKELVGNHLENHIEVEYAFQEMNDIPDYVVIPEERIKPWGTAHALYSIRNLVKEDFLILNADDFYGRDSFIKVADYLRNSNDEFKACMPGYKLKYTLADSGTVTRGICEVENGYLTKIDERFKIKREDGIIKYYEEDKSFPLNEDSLASMNMWGLSKNIFKYIDEEINEFFKANENNLDKAECLLPVVIQNLIKKNLIKVKVLNTASTWMGVTYKEDAPKVIEGINNLIKNDEYPAKLWKE